MLAGHSATLWQGGVYIWGGKTDAAASVGEEPYSDSMYLLNPHQCLRNNVARLERIKVTGSSQPSDGFGSSSVPKGRAFHSAALYGQHIFITGGLSEMSSMSADDIEVHGSSVPVFNLERRSWATKTTFGDVPSARCHHVSLFYGDTLMLHGGYPILSNRRKELSAEEMATMQHALYDVYELHTVTLRWRRIHTTPSPSLWGHSAILYNKDVIVFGGVDVVENAETNSIAVWNPNKQRWMWVDYQNLDLRCAMHTAVQDGSRMFVFGGISFRTKSHLRTLHEFNLDFGNWRELHPQGAVPRGRIGHAAVVFQRTLFVIGGTVRGDGDESGDSVDRELHMYHIDRNLWTTCDMVVSEDATEAPQIQEEEEAPQHAWGAPDHAVSDRVPTDHEWRNTDNNIKDTIARAKAIQSLTGGAASALQQTLLSRQGLNASNAQEQHTQGSPNRGVRSADHDTWKVIDHLKGENEKLRKQLELLRTQPVEVVGGSSRNPYEVPIYNTSPAVLSPAGQPANEEAKGRSALDSYFSYSVPRLNINVADPPRVVGGDKLGHMSRDAVAALVNSSLRRNQPASLSMASRLQNKGPSNINLDPMSYLYTTQNVARSANAVDPHTGPMTYDQLLARTGGGGYANQDTGVPASLQPLLSLLSSSAGGMGMQGIMSSNYESANARSQPSQPPAHADPSPASPPPVNRLHNPSLSKVVHGQSAMLSLGHLRSRN